MSITLILTGHSGAVFTWDASQSVQVMQENSPVITGVLKGVDPLAYSGAKAIRIYLGSQRAFLTESGAVVKTYRISSGAPATPTPQGEFQIYKKQDLRVSSQSVPYRMPNYMAFTKNRAFGLHGLPYLGGSKEKSAYWNEAQEHIGIPVSHGCVRFLPEDAVEIYEWAEVGMPVYIEM
jgi:lipoprotein-anchoring transpeptidase ErfK/SrfK